MQQGRAVYLALEGEGRFPDRIEAFRLENLSVETPNVPFDFIPTRLDLAADADTLITDLKAQLPEDPSVIVIDTLNRSLNGSEGRDEDMAAYIQGADKIREAFNCAVIIVHHCGVEASRPRGHTSLTGAADCQIKVARSHNGAIETTVEWMKDGPEGEQTFSRLESVEVGLDEDGEPLTACVVVEAQATATTSSGPKLTKNQQTYFEILVDVVDGGLTADEWAERAREIGIGRSRRADHWDMRKKLKARKLVYEHGGRWYVQQRV